MGVKKLKIEMEGGSNSSDLSFREGQVIIGQLTIETSEDVQTNGIYIKIKGKAWVQFQDDEALHTGKQKLLDAKFYLLGTGSSREILPRGNHSLPFEITLPLCLPSSIVVKRNGAVSYKIQAGIKKSWGFDTKYKRPFRVDAILDLNTMPGLNEPSEKRRLKKNSGIFSNPGSVEYVLKVNKQGYVPGELIEFTVEVNNQSLKDVPKVELQLLQTMYLQTPKTKKPYPVINKAVCTAVGPGVKQGARGNWTGEVVIPPLPLSGFPHCSFINVEYKLQVKESGLFSKCCIPITIGSVPFRVGLTVDEPRMLMSMAVSQ